MSISDKLHLNPESLRDVQILIVDSDRDSRELYAFVLEGYGAQVTTTNSVRSGLDLLNKIMPRILICETRFPGESIHPLLRRIQYLALRYGKTIPILVTATSSLADFTQEWQLQPEAHLLKPFHLSNFVDEVCHLTQEH